MICDQQGRQMWKFRAKLPGLSDPARIEVTQGEAYRSDYDAYTVPTYVEINGAVINPEMDEGFTVIIGRLDRRTTEEVWFEGFIGALWAVQHRAERIGHMTLAKWAEERRERAWHFKHLIDEAREAAEEADRIEREIAMLDYLAEVDA